MAYNLTISTGADANVSRTTGANATTFTATGTGANANAAEISADGVSSSARKSVTVTTGSSGAEAGNITLAAPVSDGAGPGSAPIFDTLVLSAGGAVSQATSGTALVVNTLSVNAGGGVDLRDTGNVITQITGLTAGGDVMLVDSRQLQIDAVDVGSQHDITITVPVIDLGGGNGTSLRARDATFIGGAGGGVSVELYGSVQVRNLTLSGPNAVNLRAATTSGTANTYGIGGLLTITAPSGRIGGALTGAGTFEYASAGTLQLAGPVSLSGGVRIDAGVLQLVDPAAAIPNAQPSGEMGGSITGPVVDNGVLRFSRAGVTSYAGVISGSGAVTVDGGGNLGLSGANTYTGGTTVTASTVAVGHATAGVLDALGSGAVALNNATLFIGTPGVLTNPITVNGAATLGGGGFTLQSTISGAGSLTYNVPAVTLTGVDNRTQGATNLVFFVTVTATTPNSLSGVSDYNLASGTTLSIGSASQLSNTVFSIGSLSGAGTVQANQPGKTFALSVGATGASSTFSGVLTQTMGGFLQLSKVGAGVLTLTGANTYAGGANIGAGVLRIGNGGTTGSITGDVTDNAVLQFSRSDATPFAGAISGSGKVLVDSGGTLTLSAANTYSGGTTVTGGATLVANHADGATLNSDALGSGPVTLNNGVLAENDGTLIGNAVIVASGGGGLSGVGGNINIAGAISGSGPLTTSGPVFLNGDDSGFSGALTVASGQVSAGVANALSPNSAVSVAAGAVLRLGASQVIASLSGAGTVQGLVQGMGASLTTGGSGASTLFSGVLQGIGPGFPLALTKTGAGVFTLTGANTYTGATLVNGGVLAVDGSLTSAVTVASGGTLRGTGTDSAGVTVQAGGTFAPGEGAGAFTVGGALSLGANSTFADTATSATAYGTANVAGLVTLGGSLNFNVTSAAVLPVGTSFVLVHETGATAVAGAFANAADGGAYTTASGYTFRVSYSGGAGGHDVVLTETAAPSLPVTDTQTTSATTDKATATPFAGVTVTDPAGGAETARITYAAANGALTLTGAGATLTGSAGAYTLTAASDTALNAALRALTFTPTPNQVAGGATVATTFTTSLSDAAGRMGGAVDTTTVTGVNDAPTISGVPASVTAPAAAPVTLAPSLMVVDPDAGPMVRSGQVTITSGFTAGDVLTATPAAGVTASFDAATGVLTLSGTASDAAYQQTLDTVAFRHDGPVAAGTRSVTFSVVDDQGATSNTAAETVNVSAVGGYTPPSAPMQTPSQAAGFTTQTDNLIRVAPSDTALNDPTSPLYAQAQAGAQIAARFDAGQLSAPDAQAALYHLVDGTTSVAEIAYAFFTGKTPTAAGLNYLVHSPANPTDLNDAYYARFSTENRYINFASNLATGAGAGAAQFQAAYGSLSLSDTVAKAYAAVFGVAPAAGKVDAILNAQVSNGLGGTETRAQYFADITGGSAQAQKAAAIGFLLADSVKEGFGAYQQADLHFLADLAHGTAAFNVDLLAAYGQAPTLVGQPVLDPTLGS